jgi:UDP-galactopyranose mutase
MKGSNYDIIIVGAGISGAVLAERYANILNKKVLIIEKRNHISGNCYDYVDGNGILISKYGAHLFHTNFEDVWRYVNNFSKWYPYHHKVLSFVEGKLVPVPVNITTVNSIFNINIKNEREMREWIGANAVKIENPKNSEESALSRVGKVLYEKMFKNYTKKQWDLWPRELDSSVMDRIPVRTNFEDGYFSDKFQALPEDGYTAVFDNMLNSKRIDIELNTDFFKIKDKIGKHDKLFFTGPIDEFFDYKFGKLQYRCLNFEFENHRKKFFQTNSVINYPNGNKFTRIVEYKHFSRIKKGEMTTISKEYPTWEGEPCYPVPRPVNNEIYKKYELEAKRLEKENIYLVGRLANYKYINIDQAFKNSLDLFNNMTYAL